MNIIPFEDLNITTMTLVMSLTRTVNMDIAYHLLPWIKVDIKPTRGASKYKLPHCKTPGSILSLGYKGQRRGAILSHSTQFKNAVSLYISTTKKNISVKLAPSSIQMCGASSRKDGIEASEYLLYHLNNIQASLNRFTNDTVERDRIFNFVKNFTRGAPTKKKIEETKNFTNISLRIYHEYDDYEINSNINEEMIDIIAKNNNFNKQDLLFLLSFTNDFIFHSDFCSKCNFIFRLQSVLEPIENEPPLQIIDLREAMVNYNYSLGFEVDRALLNEYIDGQEGFISRYNNALMTSVKIELPYEPEVDAKRKRNKIPHHTFLVYKSGAVTQSGPGGKLMKEVYELFMNTIAQIYPYIQYKV